MSADRGRITRPAPTATSAPGRPASVRGPASAALGGLSPDPAALGDGYFTQRLGVRAKLTVGQPNDPEEHAADAAARAVAGGGVASPPAAGASQRAPADPAFVASLGPAGPLPRGLRGKLEQGFGRDLGGVQVHAEAPAQRAAAGMGARAFAVGEHVAFGVGQLDPHSRAGVELAAHEVAHVVSERGGRVRRQLVGYPQLEGPPGSKLRAAALRGFRHVLETNNRDTFVEEFSKEFKDIVDESDPKAEALKTAVAAATKLSLGKDGDEPKDAYHLLGALAALDDKAGGDDLAETPELSLGLSLALSSLAEETAMALLQALEPGPWTTDGTEALRTIDQATTSADVRYTLEIEATTLALVQARATWNGTPFGARGTIGQQIAMLARRLLLLDAKLHAVRQIPPDKPAALEAALKDAGGQIASMRAMSKEENASLNQLGDSADLLAPQQLTPGQPLTQVAAVNYDAITTENRVEPDTAFPRATDQATAAMTNSMATAIQAKDDEAARLRAALVPANPTYTLPEFSAVYDRWRGFVSPAADRRNPLFNFIAGLFDRDVLLGPDDGTDKTKRDQQREKVKTPYELLGTPGRALEQASFSVGRYLMLTMVAPMLAQAMSGPNPQFSRREIGALGTRRDPLRVGGGASQVGLDPRTRSRLPDGQATDSATDAAAGWSGDAAARFTAVAKERIQAEKDAQAPGVVRKIAGSRFDDPVATRNQAQDLARLYGPRAAGMRQPDAPITGLREVSAQEGWAYLIDIEDFQNGDVEVVQRDANVMPADVVAYLAAARAANVMAQGPYQPTATAADGSEVAIGDRPTREQGGLAAARARAGSDLLDADTLSTAERTRFDKSRDALAQAPAAHQADPSQQLIADLDRYLNTFFTVHNDGTWRFSAVLLIAVKEHGVAQQLQESISPLHLGEVAAFSTGVSLLTKVLNTRGVLGQIVGEGLNKYLSLQGSGLLASAVGIATFLMKMGDVVSLNDARAWAQIMPAIVGDLSNLIDAVVTHAVGAVTEPMINRIVDGPKATPREFGGTVRDLAANPAARQAMLEATDAHMAEMARGGRRDSADYRALEAFRSQLVEAAKGPQVLTPEVTRALDEPIPGTTDESAAKATFELGPPRTQAERAALDAEIPADLRGRVRIVEDPLLTVGREKGKATEVQVVVGDREVQIRVGRDADAASVAAHIDAARDGVRFTGTEGRVRNLIGRLQERLGLESKPRPGQRRYEAGHEVAKLERMLEDLNARKEWLEQTEAAIEKGQTLSDEQRAELDLQIASLERQIAFHARDLGSMAPGRGYVAVADRPGSIRDTVEAALVDGGETTDAARIRAQKFVAAARKAGVLDAVEDLANAGVLQRVARAGGAAEGPLNELISRLQAKGGYGEVIQADIDVSAARKMYGKAAGEALHARPTGEARTGALAAAEWPVDATGTYDANKLPKGWTAQKIGQYAARAKEPPPDAPRLVFRRWRYVQTRENPLPFNEWVKIGYQANQNRQASSPHEPAAIAARGAAPNNLPESWGGQQTYDYEEWAEPGGRGVSRRDQGRALVKGEVLRYETTRPDGIRPRADGGFDVVEHKHMLRGESVLNDDIQLRAQSEMARKLGRGTHEIVMTSETLPAPGALPDVRPSGPLGERAAVFYYNTTLGKVTHQWKLGKWEELK